MPRSLVTGGAGFLGSHLCDSLMASGHSVVCLDNLFTGNRQNIRHLEGRRGFTFVHHDVVHPFDLDVDFIWNMACPAAPGHYRFEPVKTTMTSVPADRRSANSRAIALMRVVSSCPIPEVRTPVPSLTTTRRGRPAEAGGMGVEAAGQTVVSSFSLAARCWLISAIVLSVAV
jgi:hypothetical protein